VLFAFSLTVFCPSAGCGDFDLFSKYNWFMYFWKGNEILISTFCLVISHSIAAVALSSQKSTKSSFQERKAVFLEIREYGMKKIHD
jgi:hypothetical protein